MHEYSHEGCFESFGITLFLSLCVSRKNGNILSCYDGIAFDHSFFVPKFLQWLRVAITQIPKISYISISLLLNVSLFQLQILSQS